MSIFILRRKSGIPITVWLGTNIMEPSITPNSDSVESKSPEPLPRKQTELQYDIEEGKSLYRRVMDCLGSRIKDGDQSRSLN